MAGPPRYWPWWLLLVALGSRLAVADGGPELLAGLVYADRAGEGLLADVYVPAGAGPFPAVLCVHGGAWTFGNRLQMVGVAAALRQAGYVAVSIDYRLAPQHVFPAQLDDCRAALGWLRGNAARFKIDPRRIAAWGYSAGGQLVTLMALTETPSKPGGKTPERIKVVVAGGTPTDFRQIPPDSRRLAFWLGGTRRVRPEAYQAASPIGFVTPDDPPVFLYHGELDRVVSIDEPKAMFDRLRTAGVTAEMYVVPRAGHVGAFFDGEAIRRGIGFLDKNLSGSVGRPATTTPTNTRRRFMSNAKRVSRRAFLQQSAVAGLAGAAVLRTGSSGAQTKTAASDKLNVAVIGVAGRGAGNLAGVSGENVVALCDADEKRLDAAAAKFPAAKKYFDFRQMLADLDKKIDAVAVSTPDHTHAPAAVMAMRMGKHCYCEKPLSHNVFEARTAAQVAAEKKLATQMGTQIHAGENYRRVVELIQSGAIGAVGEVHVWCGKGWGGGERPTETPPVPPHLHWDTWLGPAPYRPYHPCYVPANWRRWWDFGTGTLGDMACHYMDLPFWALALRHPTTVEAEGPPVHPETCPLELTVRYEFPARGKQPPVRLTWYDGPRRPAVLSSPNLLAAMASPAPKTAPKTAPGKAAPKKPKPGPWGSGVLFVGSEGMLLADYGGWKLLPEDKFAKFQPPKPTIPPSIGHHAEWILACKTGSPTTCNFNYSGALAEAVLLGCVAYRTGEKLQWDAKNLQAAGCPEADKYLRRKYREGWTL